MRLADFMPWTQGPPVFRRMGRHYLAGSLLAVAIAIAVAVLREPLGVHREPWARFLPLGLGVLPLLVFTPVTWWLARRVRVEFDAAGGRLCTHCAYNVGPIGSTGLCPECGNRFDSTVDAALWGSIGFRPKT